MYIIYVTYVICNISCNLYVCIKIIFMCIYVMGGTPKMGKGWRSTKIARASVTPATWTAHK